MCLIGAMELCCIYWLGVSCMIIHFGIYKRKMYVDTHRQPTFLLPMINDFLINLTATNLFFHYEFFDSGNDLGWYMKRRKLYICLYYGQRFLFNLLEEMKNSVKLKG